MTGAPLVSSSTSSTSTMFGCRTTLAALASRWTRCTTSGLLAYSGLRILIATSRPATSFVARYTSPMPPAPRRFVSLKRPAITSPERFGSSSSVIRAPRIQRRRAPREKGGELVDVPHGRAVLRRHAGVRRGARLRGEADGERGITHLRTHGAVHDPAPGGRPSAPRVHGDRELQDLVVDEGPDGAAHRGGARH